MFFTVQHQYTWALPPTVDMMSGRYNRTQTSMDLYNNANGIRIAGTNTTTAELLKNGRLIYIEGNTTNSLAKPTDGSNYRAFSSAAIAKRETKKGASGW